MKNITLSVLFCCLIFSCTHSSKNESFVNLEDFIEKDSLQSTTYDATLSIIEAINQCRETNASKLIIPAGKYRITPAYSSEKYVFVSNNDPGLKSFLFDLSGIQQLEIEGNGAEFILEGFICPFLLSASKNITIRNLSIDYKRPFHSEGIIKGTGKGYIDLNFSEEFPYEIKDEKLRFKDENGTIYPYGSLLEFNTIREETEYKVFDSWLWESPLNAEALPNGNVRVFKDKLVGTNGNTLVFGAANRLIPAFTISDSENILLSNINIHHCGGMGVIAQRTKNIELNKVAVSPRNNGKRIVSATADATHFVNCSGYLKLIDCLFEKQKDDATNIHGIYAVIDKIISPTEIIVRLKHRQQFGFDFIKEGMSLEFEDSKSLLSKGIRKVGSVQRLNKECTLLSFAEAIPDDTNLSDPIANVDDYPEVLIKGCTIQNNRARGLLLGSRARIVVDSNYFHTPGSAILFEGDGYYWYEQSGVRDVTISNNVFDNCNFGNDTWGVGCIGVGTRVDKDRETSRYHKNIVVENNTFKIFDLCIAYLYCVDGFTFKNNKIEQQEMYLDKYARDKTDPFAIENCDNVLIEDVHI